MSGHLTSRGFTNLVGGSSEELSSHSRARWRSPSYSSTQVSIGYEATGPCHCFEIACLSSRSWTFSRWVISRRPMLPSNATIHCCIRPGLVHICGILALQTFSRSYLRVLRTLLLVCDDSCLLSLTQSHSHAPDIFVCCVTCVHVNRKQTIQDLLRLPCAKVLSGTVVPFNSVMELMAGLPSDLQNATASNVCITVWTPILLAILHRQWFYIAAAKPAYGYADSCRRQFCVSSCNDLSNVRCRMLHFKLEIKMHEYMDVEFRNIKATATETYNEIAVI